MKLSRPQSSKSSLKSLFYLVTPDSLFGISSDILCAKRDSMDWYSLLGFRIRTARQYHFPLRTAVPIYGEEAIFDPVRQSIERDE